MTRHLAIFTLVALTASEALGVVMFNATTLPGQAYMDYGAQFQNSMVGIKRVSTANNGAFGFVSGVQIDERHVITAAHAIDSATGFWPKNYLFVTMGSNLYSASTDVAIKRMSIHPSYTTGALGIGIDLVIFELDSVVPGRGVSIATSTAPNGQSLSFAGYGQHAVVDGTLQTLDGHLRAFDARSLDPSGIFDNYYYTAASASESGPLQGKGANRDSGGGVYYQNDLVGIMIAVSGGTSSVGFTTFLDLTRPEIRSWIAEFRASSVGGALGFRLADLNITPAGGGQGPRVSGKVHGGAGLGSIRIEACSTLGTGAVWETLGTLTLDQSGSATSADLLDNRPEAVTATRTFYRAATVP
jgi:hypothetical protein